MEEAVEVSKKLQKITSGTLDGEAIDMTSAVISQILNSSSNPNISYNTEVSGNAIVSLKLGPLRTLPGGQLLKQS